MLKVEGCDRNISPCETRARCGARPCDPGPRHEAEPSSSRGRSDAGSGPRVVVAVFVVLTRATSSVIVVVVVAAGATALFVEVTVVSGRSNDLKEDRTLLTVQRIASQKLQLSRTHRLVSSMY